MSNDRNARGGAPQDGVSKFFSEYDNPVNSGKIHPTHKQYAIAFCAIQMILNIIQDLYIFGVMNADSTPDLLMVAAKYLPPIVIFIIIKPLRVQKVTKEDR